MPVREEPIAEYLEGPVCRLCKYALKSSSGCTACLDIKRNLIWPAVAQVEATETAKTLTQQAARMIRRQLKKLDRITQSGDYNPDATKEIVALSRALTGLADQIRKLEDREAEYTAGLTFDEQCRLIAETFFAQLPQEHQARLLGSMTKIYDEQRAPYELASGDTDQIVDV